MKRKRVVKVKNKILVGILLLFTFSTAKGQVDSVFHYEAFIDSVLKNHPLAVRAGLIEEVGNAKELKARGFFDPKAFGNVGQKYFDEKKYYSVIDAGFKFPTWLGIDLKGGYEQNIGSYVNPEHQTPISGLVYAGVEVPIGKGLFIDERRAALRKAEIFQESTEVQQKIQINQLLLDASQAYWNWYQSYHTLKVYDDALNTAEQRYGAVKNGAYAGDRPFIDTVEAGIQVQNRKVSYQEAELQFENATAQLSVYLWLDGQVPIALTDAKIPPSISSTRPLRVNDSYEEELDSIVYNHPELLYYDFKLASLDIDRRWAAEQLKPELTLNYNPITSATVDGFGNELAINNYKWGVNFSMPIILRKERGELKLAKLKIQETKLDQMDKGQQIKYKAQTALNTWKTTFSQLGVYRNTVDNYYTLFQSEIQLFDNGESNLFMVNSREVGYINTQIKFISLQTKNHLAELKAKYFMGILLDELK